MADSSLFLICNACGTQYATSDRNALTTCFICDDPRQYTPPSGQTFTTLSALRAEPERHNEFHPFPSSSSSSSARFTSIVTVPKLAIGQRAILIHTPGATCCGVQAMVVSHPYFYSSHLEWAEALDCTAYLAAEDAPRWLARRSSGARQVLLDRVETRVEVDGEDTGVRIVKLGGHFPGSLVLLCNGHLLTADTLMMTPAGLSNWSVDALGNPRERPKGVNTFSFLWSIPNMIPMSAAEIVRMWGILKNYDFTSAHGLFLGWDIKDNNLKGQGEYVLYCTPTIKTPAS
ncbi:hypothetical protein N658DRAFT_503779 [Parathielavia hyrcaniae]|uniref:Metallo-beta-lactamase domain-containing protein n=1 Tax=Parathielavia hyrcaniae TaxID=113614 RepID=A0AAN6T6E6_9PEZI|nr:hypothetical protein N658DRAFT_503779 [Parathielavia hyrcaniae]